MVITKDSGKNFTRPMDYMIYIFRMHRLIEDHAFGDAKAHLHLIGKLNCHMTVCEKEQCICSQILDQIDDVQAQRDIMDRDEDLQRELDEADNKS
jgi:hypothetical protein